jgi:hypothetical protein
MKRPGEKLAAKKSEAAALESGQYDRFCRPAQSQDVS